MPTSTVGAKMSACKETRPRRSLATRAGYLVVPKHHAKTVQNILSVAGWTSKIDPSVAVLHGRALAIPLTSEATDKLTTVVHERDHGEARGKDLATQGSMHESDVPLALHDLMQQHAEDIRVCTEVEHLKHSDRLPLAHLAQDWPDHAALVQKGPGKAFTFIDLFAGIGGFRIALEGLGGQCLGSCEMDRFARKTYEKNFMANNEAEMDKTDLLKEYIGEFYAKDATRLCLRRYIHTCDILTGGFPCQSFSTLGEQKGTDDDRGKLFYHLVRLIDECRPKYFILENVAALTTMDNGRVFDEVKWRLEHLDHFTSPDDMEGNFSADMGRKKRKSSNLEDVASCVTGGMRRADSNELRHEHYHVTAAVIDAARFVPQRRQRVYIVGVRKDRCELGRITPYCGFDGMPDLGRTKKAAPGVNYEYFKDTSDARTVGSILEPQEGGMEKWILGQSLEKQVKNRQWAVKHGQPDAVEEAIGTEAGEHCTGRFLTGSERFAMTLTSSYKKSPLLYPQFVQLSNGQLRFFTPRECLRLQGFPEWFEPPGEDGNVGEENRFYRQIGNAVCPPVARAVAEPLVRDLGVLASVS